MLQKTVCAETWETREEGQRKHEAMEPVEQQRRGTKEAWDGEPWGGGDVGTRSSTETWVHRDLGYTWAFGHIEVGLRTCRVTEAQGYC